MSIDLESSDFRFLLSRMERGDVVLFCGAGFSIDCKNIRNTSPPLGGPLAHILAEIAGLEYDNEPLSIVYKAVRNRVGTKILHEKLRELYTVMEFDDWYTAVSSLIWHRIYTVNIDNLLEKIFSKNSSQKLNTIVCPASHRERDPHFEEVQAVHLHGFVNDLDRGMTFTLDEFAKQQTEPNRWYIELADDVFHHSVVFVGSLMEESPFHHYLALRDQKQQNIHEFRPESFLVCPRIGKIRAKALREQNITPIESTAKEFFESLRDHLAEKPITVNSVRKAVFPHVFLSDVSNKESIVAYFDPILPNNLPPTPRVVPHGFFLGAEPTWKDITEGRDGKRVTTDIILDEIDRHGDRFQCLVIHGPAGSGKTTIMKRLACELASKRETVYFARNEHRIELDGVIDLCSDPSHQTSRVYVLIDTATRQLQSIYKMRDSLKNADRMTLILSDRSNAFARREHALQELDPIKIPVHDLTQEEVESILERLERFTYLGALRDKTPDERISEFMDRASRQLLVAMREATSGKGFDLILADEYKALVPDAKLAYTVCCLAVAQGAPGVYRRDLFPTLGRTDFQKGSIIADLLRGVLVPANDSGTLLKPRHRVIAHKVASEIAPIGMKVEALTRFLKQISSDINRISIRSRSPVFIAYRSLINSNGLHALLDGNREIILGLYEELRDHYKDQFLFWLHYGMAYVDQGDLDVAENYLNQAYAICQEIRGNPFQIRHQQGILYLMQACRCHPPSVGKERANEGIHILEELIRERGDIDSYPYTGFMDHVTKWYILAGDLISNDEWEHIKNTAILAARKYPLDDMVLDGRDKVEKAYMMRLAVDRDTPEEAS